MFKYIWNLVCKRRNGFLRDWLYKLIIEYTITPAIDILVLPKDKPGHVLLSLRSDQPAMNEWWLFGGHIKSQDFPAEGMISEKELLERATNRIAKREFGIQVEILGMTEGYGTHFSIGPYGGPIRFYHRTVIVRLLQPLDKAKLDRTSHKTELFTVEQILNGSFHPHVKEVTQLCQPLLPPV